MSWVIAVVLSLVSVMVIVFVLAAIMIGTAWVVNLTQDSRWPGALEALCLVVVAVVVLVTFGLSAMGWHDLVVRWVGP
jgi:hypothetical protein